MLTILGFIAEFEREIMLERQKEGIAKAQSEGKYRGRAPTARAKSDQVFALDRAGKTREAIAKEVGISLISVYRILRTRKDAENAPRCIAGYGDSDTSASQRIIEEQSRLLLTNAAEATFNLASQRICQPLNQVAPGRPLQ